MRLTVLYDATCSLCRAARDWMQAEPQYVEIDFVAAGSDAARRRFPALNHADTLIDVTAVDDAGNVYVGAKTWLVCLWALKNYREWAIRLSGRALPAAKPFIAWISRNRHRFA